MGIVIGHKCEDCGHIWLPEHDGDTMPDLCPECKSRYVTKPPVYVETTDEGEHLVYQTTSMEAHKEYTVKWLGQYYTLIKTDDGVKILELEVEIK